MLPRDVIRLVRQKRSVCNTTQKIQSLRVLGGSLSHEQREWLEKNVANEVVNSYSSNETGQIAEMDCDGTGIIYKNVEVLITNPDRIPLNYGQPGYISIKSPAPIRGYIGNDELNKKHFSDGWFLSNDYGFLEGPRKLKLLGRADDIINIDGIKIHPLEIEQQLRDQDFILDVAIFSRDIEIGGTRVIVCIEVGFKEINIQKLVSLIDGLLNKTFQFYDIVFFKSFPQTETAKTKRFLLKKIAVENLIKKNQPK